jgi:hypothetical protein
LLGLPFHVVVIVTFAAASIFADSPLVRLGCAIFSASAAYTLYRIIRIDWATDATAECIPHYRAYLIRRQDAFHNFQYWGSLPATIGVIFATLGWYLAEPTRLFRRIHAGDFLGWATNRVLVRTPRQSGSLAKTNRPARRGVSQFSVGTCSAFSTTT